jgi:hypothetical protein
MGPIKNLRRIPGINPKPLKSDQLPTSRNLFRMVSDGKELSISQEI